MLSIFSPYLVALEDFVWTFFGFTAIVSIGLYFTFRSRFFQFLGLGDSFRLFIQFFKGESQDEGIHPLKAFFASVGGCVGIGNVVGICTAIQLGGPGALFWIWVTALTGMILKYVEVYLGMQHRVKRSDGGYTGGPMFYLQKAYKNRWIPLLVCVLLGIYGVEVFQFSVVAHSVSHNFSLPYIPVVFTLLGLVLYAGMGGIQRVGNIASWIIPPFVIVYLCMGLTVLFLNASAIPQAFYEIFIHAFTPYAAVGGFVGSTVLYTISQGIRAGCYTGDVGIGYTSVIHSESRETSPQKQALLTFLGIFFDTFLVCTTSILLILVTGVWKEGLPAEMLVQAALEKHFSYVPFFMPIFLFLLGYSTINAYFVVGLQCSRYIFPKNGSIIYYFYALSAFLLFAFRGTQEALSLMYLTGGLLVLLNCVGFFLLRKDISYKEKALPLNVSETAANS